ncbi:MAG: GNAT family N-acetyltransferase, partial [Myxococcales bacterium]|nr:GNAT family N-acetyltransferase [Myxococcales bacterium]
MQLDSSPMPYPRAFRETFQRARNAQLRADIDRGRALWRCAWIDGQIAGSMGLVAQDGLGRYQSVQTHPDFRRQGVCSALLAAIADAGAVELGAEQLVIVTDAGSVAERIYRQQGFVAAMPTHGVCLPPQR